MGGDNFYFSGSRLRGFVSPWRLAVLLGVTYYIGARLGLLFTVEGTGISVFWFPNAVTLAALLLAPKRWWPHLVIGSWMGDIAAEVATSVIVDALVFSAANLTQTLICAFVLRKASINPIHSPRHYLLLLFCYVGCVAPAGSALVTLYMSLDPAASGLWTMWWSWWLGDGLYVMTLTPLILALVRPSDIPIRGGRSEAVILVAALSGAYFIDFFLVLPNEHAISNLVLPLLLWAALRFGLRGAGMAVSILIAVAGLSMLKPGVTLQGGEIAEDMLKLQLLLFGNACSAMILAIVSEDWRRAEKARAAAFSEAENAVESAERANAAKSHFLAAASHDLRQPFQALRLFIDVLDQAITKPSNRKVVDAAKTALSGGECLLTALLDLSSLEAGEAATDKRVFPIADILNQLAAECAKTALQKNIDLVMVTSSAMVASDPVLLTRLLRNLLHNAIKYTERGRILLGCRRLKNGVRIEVWDTGIGIPANQQDHIFDEFYQIGNHGRDKAKGLGIGLAVVKRTATLLGHQITLRSVPGQGSVFAVTVGASVAPPAPSQINNDRRKAERRRLIQLCELADQDVEPV